jgi:hypothetical protein
MFNLTEAQKAYIAGIIDSDGSMSLVYSFVKLKQSYVRQYKLSISTKDKFIVNTISNWLNLDYSSSIGKSKMNVLRMASAQKIKFLLIDIYPYLYTKQPRAKLMIEAIDIKDGRDESYTEEEKQLWFSKQKRLCELNAFGIKSIGIIDDELRNHQFHWAWIAGITDGDGSLPITSWSSGLGHKILKPTYQLGMCHEMTIRYIAEKIGANVKIKQDKRPNRNKSFNIRILPTKLIEFLPHIIEYLVFKKTRAIYCLELCQLRQINNRQMTLEQKERCKELVVLIQEENKNSYL